MQQLPVQSTEHVSRLAAEVVTGVRAQALLEANSPGAWPTLETSLRILAEALHALGFRFHANGTASYANQSAGRLPGGLEREVCVAAAEFIASLVPILGEGGRMHGMEIDMRAGLQNAFDSMSELLAAAGYLADSRAAHTVASSAAWGAMGPPPRAVR